MMTEEQAKAYRLSTNFTLWEFLRSDEAIKHRLMSEQMSISKEHIDNLQAICKNLLQPLRTHLKCTIIINSGYRSPELNAKVKGSKNSDHMKGMAADCVCSRMDELWNMVDFFKFKQALRYTKKGFIHLSFDRKDNRKDKRNVEA